MGDSLDQISVYLINTRTLFLFFRSTRTLIVPRFLPIHLSILFLPQSICLLNSPLYFRAQKIFLLKFSSFSFYASDIVSFLDLKSKHWLPKVAVAVLSLLVGGHWPGGCCGWPGSTSVCYIFLFLSN